MGLAPTRRIAKMVGTAQLAEMMGCSTEVARDRVTRAHAANPGRWLRKNNTGHRNRGHYEINLSMFRAEHPEYFEAPSVADVEEKIESFNTALLELTRTVRALGAKIREISKRVAELEGKRADVDDHVVPFAIGEEPKTNHGLPPGWSSRGG